MGMFDVVLIDCPSCGSKDQVQSKGGECLLLEYELHEAPRDVLSDINRHAPHQCDECGYMYTIELKVIATVS